MSRLKKLGIIFILCAVFSQNTQAQAPAPAPTKTPSKKSNMVAQINSRTISLAEFNQRYEAHSQLMPGKAPPKSEVLKQIVNFELARAEALKLKLNQDADIKNQFDILLYQAIVRRNIQPKIEKLRIEESEVRKYYEDNPLIRTSHIILLSKPGMDEKEMKELKERADNVLSQVQKGKQTFEELTRQYSEGPSAKTGGDVDWGARNKLLPEYYEAALALKKVGDVSGVVETPYGFHIIKLTGKKGFSEIDPTYRDFIIRAIRENKGQAIYNAYFEGLKKRYKVVVNEQALN